MKFFSYSKIVLIAIFIGSSSLLFAKDSVISADIPDSDPLERFSDVQKKKLSSGEVVFEHTEKSKSSDSVEGHGSAYVIINSPIGDCFKIFCDFEKQYRYFPNMACSYKFSLRETTLKLL